LEKYIATKKSCSKIQTFKLVSPDTGRQKQTVTSQMNQVACWELTEKSEY